MKPSLTGIDHTDYSVLDVLLKLHDKLAGYLDTSMHIGNASNEDA